MADGMDVVEMKREYGRDFFLRAASTGGSCPAAPGKRLKEVERVMTVLPIGDYPLHLGGLIFHGTPAENYFFYAERVGI
jgi:hypothetical protein